MIPIDIKVEGVPGALARLDMMGQDLQRKGVAAGLAPLSTAIRKRMVQETPVDQNIMRKAINTSQLNDRQAQRIRLNGRFVGLKAGQVARLIGPNKRVNGRRRAQFAHLVEGGTKPHKIRPKEPGGKLQLRNGQFVDEVDHPGTKPNPFMQRSLKAVDGQAKFLFERGLHRFLKRKGYGS